MEEETPKTKTEPAGSGSPPGKTRIGAGESGSSPNGKVTPWRRGNPKTKTESAGGGLPPGKTRIGAGESENDPPFKRSLGSLEAEARQILDAMESEFDKNNPGGVDRRELTLLKELLGFVTKEIGEHGPDRQVLGVLEGLIWRSERREDLKKFLKNET